MADEEERESRRERRARKKAEKKGEAVQEEGPLSPEMAGRLVYPPPGQPTRPQGPAAPYERPALPTAGGPGLPPQVTQPGIPTGRPYAGPPVQPGGVEAPAARPPATTPQPQAKPLTAPFAPMSPRQAAEPGQTGPGAGERPTRPAVDSSEPARPLGDEHREAPPAGPPDAKEPETATPPAAQEQPPTGPPQEEPAPQPQPPGPLQPQPPQAQPPQQQYPPQGYYWPPPPWYPSPYVPPGYGYPPGYPPPGQGAFPPGYLPPPGPPLPQQPLGPQEPFGPPVQEGPIAPATAREEEEFRELTGEETSHWRVDLKWIFGVIAVLLLLSTLTIAGLYRVTSPGRAKDILTPLIESSTSVKTAVRDNYKSLRSKARRRTGATFAIPDIGVEVTVSAGVINSSTADELAQRVISEIEKQLYAKGYKGNLPMPRALGVGEERAKAVAATVLSVANKKTHDGILWPMIILAVLTLGVGVIFAVFSRGWGKVMGIGIVFIAGSLPASLMLRIGDEFLWGPSSGVFKGAAHQAIGSAGASMLIIFDIALAAGAVVLLVGVIGGVMSRRTRERVPPFVDLKRPEQAVAGGPPVDAGLSAPVERVDDEGVDIFPPG